jgi:hypothetical protein
VTERPEIPCPCDHDDHHPKLAHAMVVPHPIGARVAELHEAVTAGGAVVRICRACISLGHGTAMKANDMTR